MKNFSCLVSIIFVVSSAYGEEAGDIQISIESEYEFAPTEIKSRSKKLNAYKHYSVKTKFSWTVKSDNTVIFKPASMTEQSWERLQSKRTLKNKIIKRNKKSTTVKKLTRAEEAMMREYGIGMLALIKYMGLSTIDFNSEIPEIPENPISKCGVWNNTYRSVGRDNISTSKHGSGEMTITITEGAQVAKKFKSKFVSVPVIWQDLSNKKFYASLFHAWLTYDIHKMLFGLKCKVIPKDTSKLFEGRGASKTQATTVVSESFKTIYLDGKTVTRDSKARIVNKLSKKIDISNDTRPLHWWISDFQHKSDVYIVCDNSVYPYLLERHVAIPKGEFSIAEALELIIKNFLLDYTIVDNAVFITRPSFKRAIEANDVSVGYDFSRLQFRDEPNMLSFKGLRLKPAFAFVEAKTEVKLETSEVSEMSLRFFKMSILTPKLPKAALLRWFLRRIRHKGTATDQHTIKVTQ